MLSFEDAKKMFEADHYSVRSRARWQDASEENFPAAYKFIAGCWNDYMKMVDPSETVPAKVRLAFPNDEECQFFKMLGEFKEIPVDSTREEIYNSWVKRFERIRQDGVLPNLSFLKIFLSQARKHQRELLESKMSNEYIIAVISTLLYNLSGGTWQEIRIIRIMTAKYKKTEYLRFRPAPANWESTDIDAQIYDKDTGEVIHNISIKCFGALHPNEIRKWRVAVAEKNERAYQRSIAKYKANGWDTSRVKRRPEVTLWVGIRNEWDTKLTIYTAADLD